LNPAGPRLNGGKMATGDEFKKYADLNKGSDVPLRESGTFRVISEIRSLCNALEVTVDARKATYNYKDIIKLCNKELRRLKDIYNV